MMPFRQVLGLGIAAAHRPGRLLTLRKQAPDLGPSWLKLVRTSAAGDGFEGLAALIDLG